MEPAAHGKRDVDDFADLADHVDVDRTLLGGRGDVVKHQFVGAAFTVRDRQFDGIAQIDVVLKPDALGDLAVADVETRDDAFCQHEPSHLLKFSRSRSPSRPERSG